MARSRRKTLRRLLVAAFGAALAYFLDPSRGRGRRARAKDQLAASLRRRRRQAESQRRYEEGRLQGERARAQGAGTPSPQDDVTLQNEVKAALSRLAFGTQDVTVETVDGTVTLRGQVASTDQVDEAQRAVRAVPGVVSVINHLHLPQEPPPNKVPSMDASSGGDGTAIE
ncbi:MAG: BON domain-containing protein [Actinomycetota bacterium]|nr:BON domain-containing protein [Actinomycetota bacterium]